MVFLRNCGIDDKDLKTENNSIMIVKMLERKCPNCGEIVYHKTKRSCNKSILNNCICKKCVHNSLRNDDKIGKCYMCGKLHEYKFHYLKLRAEKLKCICRECLGKCRRGKIASNSLKEKISVGTKLAMENMNDEKKKLMKENQIKSFKDPKIREKISNSHKGIIKSDETRKNHRLSMIKHIKEKNNGVAPMFNIDACNFIDKYGKQKGYNFCHALNGKEYYIEGLGYFVDGYDKDKNIVFEYDESHHFDYIGNLKEKDIKRMNEIKNHLNCKIIRYNEKTKELKEY